MSSKIPARYCRRHRVKQASVARRLIFAGAPSIIIEMQSIRLGSAVCVLGLICCLGTGCGSIPHDVGLAERCADIMQRAFSSATIEIGKSDVSATSLTTIVARVEGIRSDIPPEGPVRRDLAVECQFDNNILTGFRWTAGPQH
jgi:hypothetical protein